MSKDSNYRERVKTPGWVLPVLGAAGGLWTARRVQKQAKRGAPLWRRGFTAVNSATTALTVIRFLRRAGGVAVEVEEQAIHVAVGPFEHRIDVNDVRDVRVVRYNPLLYLGWGYRFSFGGRRAFSQIGIGSGVEIAVDEDGHPRSYFISSQDPEALASAIATVAGAKT
ncbi:MAG: hypothetical protein ACYDCQ_12455 [Dehalococcoidia bacterium]